MRKITISFLVKSLKLYKNKVKITIDFEIISSCSGMGRLSKEIVPASWYSSLKVMFSILLNPDLIHSFNFLLGSNTLKGMRYGNELYGLIQTFSPKEKQAAYHLAYELARQGEEVVIVADDILSVWISLQVSYRLYTLAG